MLDNRINSILVPLIFGAAIWLLVLLSNLLTEKRLRRWAESQRLTLVEFKSAPFWRGPRAWVRTHYQQDIWVVVQDAEGRRRKGWVMRTRRWLGYGPVKIEVEWEDR